LSASEKAALDVWYIRNASLALDLRIIGMTFVSLLRGDRRCERALAQAQTRLIRPAQAGRGERAGSQSVVLLPLAVVAGTDRADSRDPMTTQSP
jgi:Bacterial sugar transferase